MRLRRHYKNYKRSVAQGIKDIEMTKSEVVLTEKKPKGKTQDQDEAREPKNVKKPKPLKMIRQFMNNQNFNQQLMVILLSLTSENMQMDRRIDGMTTTIDKVRNITELVNNGMQSMKMVSEVPKSIRRLLE
jgi:hypothetical protein